MRLQMATPWNAVIAPSLHIAEQHMDAFGLSREMWEPFAYGASLAGRQFNRIVVLRPHWRTKPEEIAAFDNEVVPRWASQTGVGGTITIV
jgi:hypothetical protein